MEGKSLPGGDGDCDSTGGSASNSVSTHDSASNSSSAADTAESAAAGKVKSKPKTTKAERRAKQEADRARKAAEGKQPRKAQTSSSPSTSVTASASVAAGPAAAEGSSGAEKSSRNKSEHRPPMSMHADDPKAQAKVGKVLARSQIPQRAAEDKCVFFSHLYQHARNFPLTASMPLNGTIHPAILQLGLWYSDYRIIGSTSRCVALLAALKEVITDYSTPPQKDMARDLEAKLKPQISYLNTCRPLATSMGNAIKHIKLCISTLPPELPEEEAKAKLLAEIDTYHSEKISLARMAIVRFGAKCIRNDSVVLTFAYSSLVTAILKEAHEVDSKQFNVIVVDSRPRYEGLTMLNELEKLDIPCTYILISSLNYVMGDVTNVLMGAASFLANGNCMSRCGTALVASVAARQNVPVHIACETYKFTERLHIDAFMGNELGDPNDLVSTDHPLSEHVCAANENPVLAGWEQKKESSVINIMYDNTPPAFISTVISEHGCIPCATVPAILRVQHTVSTPAV